ncbi:bifunctional oligoribonuclease/PAP phosphatase NrnA [Candidatus Peregrinibacteria bacterium]|nr:bifunctional oligoribonuclease/PAP phosphatase NrnA [Candidatus Peregrinibacteria bacterium]MBI3816258.1 bifunctional oligoribonuclease/PAP phosphatase NrnA [Candidatus Peregrinibacteria bacterium]
MLLTRQDAQPALALLQHAPCVRCICHRNPDGDAIGSLLGIGLLIEQWGPQREVSVHCVDPVPEMFHFLPGAFRIQPPPPGPLPQRGGGEWSGEDVIVFVDCAEPKLTEMHETHPELFDGTFKTIVIDHHHANPHFGTVNFVFPEAASTCEIIVALASALARPLTSDIATCLLTGVYTDTGGLLHSNTSANVYRTVAHLLRAGARRQEVITAVFRSAKLSTLQLWGRVLEKITLTEEGGAISAVTEGDFRATGADYSELTGAIDYVNAIPGMRFSLILSERAGNVKGSLRTMRDDVDVSAMAGKFHGGGHRKAAGFALPGKLKPEVRWKVVDGEKLEEETNR